MMKFYVQSAVILLIAQLLFLSCQSSEEPVQEAAGPRPNIVFILVDDLGKHDLGFTGSTFYETPHIDSLAARSMNFTNGYAASRVCSPSRASIMTGQFTARHGITDWIGARTGTDWRELNRHTQLLPSEYVHQLPQADTTLAEALKTGGYKTFFAGKWHLGGEGSYPEDHGFDINIGGYESGSPRGGYFSPFDNPKLPDLQPGENLSIRLANETAAFIRKNKDDSFFAFLSFYAVHGPIQTNEEKWQKYRNKAWQSGLADRGYHVERRLPIREVQDNPVYGGLVEAMDEAVGIVWHTLSELGLAENTIVVFTSDNGGVASGDNFSTTNLPLRGGKGYQWEGGIREPYLIYVPGLENAGKESETPVTGADFYPTLLDLAGLELKPGQHLDGQSLLPLLQGDKIADRSLFWHYPHYGNQGGDPASIIRKGDWKLIYYLEDAHYELYNLKDDLGETNELAGQYHDRVADLSKELLQWLNATRAKIPVKDPEYSAEREQEWLKKMKTERLTQLEKERLEMLAEGWQPNVDWWGSKVTRD